MDSEHDFLEEDLAPNEYASSDQPPWTADAVEVDAERKRHVEIAQFWHETGYVARRYARCVQTAFETQRLHVGHVALHAVRSHDALALHHRLWQLQTKLLYLRPTAAYHGVERKTAQRETTTLVQREAFHLHVKRVVCDAVHYEMGADVARLDVVWREALRFGSTRKHTVAHRTVADNERVDLQVDRRLLLRRYCGRLASPGRYPDTWLPIY